ncbi:MAG: DUF4389 domain-containing protein [Candidatus Marinimicrobia bacterium]|nr:DUF4389 domain-containing protein [Candidatus Neomarinimicrobiota bacterium]MBT3496147.1 DUF4389 domain-containing protein [Candidatus Neomarinimicrobiota bacterium]MBT3732413.1 DUF4389 domain-containing protein [Candidatus Neomarinimicrobiota bacterium]MBT4178465.1 DUF4389 domain-containing protein [Candidatus Neomarinimicrobiota bacterium]MBT5355664.1 DUF4389 domain-containing protein [Candidatus Neomarinimicrobiota bacterium]
MNNYPATLTIEYPENANRLTVFFRLFMAIPIMVILGLLSYHGYNSEQVPEESYWVGILVVPTLLMIVFRRKYPRWWFDWNVQLTKFSIRVASYILLLRHEYPSTDEEQAVHVQIDYPDVEKDLNRWLPLIKWLFILPHIFVLCFIMIGVLLCTILAWFIVLVSGKYPKSMFDFVVGSLRWTLRVQAYALLLITDQYPPFSLSE